MKAFFGSIGIALRGINHNRLRGFLSILGVVIGVVAVIGMGSLTKSMEHALAGQATQMGANSFTVERMSQFEMALLWTSGNRQELFQLWRRPPMSLDYVDELRNNPSIRSVAPASEFSMRFRREKQTALEAYPVIATNEDFLQGGVYELADGRFITADDVLRRRYVCVIGEDVAREFFAGMDPIGQQLNVGPLPCRVVGVLKGVGAALGTNPDQVAIVPVTAAVKHWRWLEWRMKLNVEAYPGMMEAAEDEAVTTLRRLRSLKPEQDNNFSVITSQMMEELFGKITGAAALVFLLIAGVSLVVAGIGIMNVMFVAVRERTREIGIRKACGASSKHILMQFAIEAVFLSSIGGIIGMAIVWGAASAIGTVMIPAGGEGDPIPINIFVPPALIVVGLIFSFLVGVVFGIIPAYRAGKLDVVDALRYE
ncbi:MAG TPA: ABC transporter permease [candidate division Zixibacteria bacterium]|nr:ABC transporter permease [candidate division Zixibacteria bacterium]